MLERLQRTPTKSLREPGLCGGLLENRGEPPSFGMTSGKP